MKKLLTIAILATVFATAATGCTSWKGVIRSSEVLVYPDGTKVLAVPCGALEAYSTSAAYRACKDATWSAGNTGIARAVKGLVGQETTQTDAGPVSVVGVTQ